MVSGEGRKRLGWGGDVIALRLPAPSFWQQLAQLHLPLSSQRSFLPNHSSRLFPNQSFVRVLPERRLASMAASTSPTFKDNNNKGLQTNMETDYVIVFRFATTSSSACSP
jgi:hypothetical protein